MTAKNDLMCSFNQMEQRNDRSSVSFNGDVYSELSQKLHFPATPSIFTLEITSSCNHDCPGCGNIFPHQKKHLEYKTWNKIIEKVEPYAAGFRITGGECTLHPEFDRIIKTIDSLDIPIVIFSNGDWEDPDKVISLISECNNCDGVLISLHGHDRQSYFEFVKTDRFDGVVSNIQKSVAAGIRVATNTVLTKKNVQSIHRIIELGKSLDVFSIAFSRYYGNNLADCELSPVEFRNIFHYILNLHRGDKSIVFNNCIPACFDESSFSMKGCTSGITHCTIGPDGMARPCTHAPIKLGNILNTPIEEIWKSDALKYWNSLIPQDCFDCPELRNCRGGCRATAYHKNLAKDPFINCGTVKNHAKRNSAEKLYLNKHDRLKKNYKLKSHPSGYYLINRSRYVNVTNDAKPILDFLDSTPEILKINEEFGTEGLNFIGMLIIKGLILLEK
ncbi:MAG: radical SAM protein [Candidatus Lokiarchaeota archaeon]|nr:radical SAM protein [Candidatus Lokiarchaeota archaeon]